MQRNRPREQTIESFLLRVESHSVLALGHGHVRVLHGRIGLAIDHHVDSLEGSTQSAHVPRETGTYQRLTHCMHHVLPQEAEGLR